MSRSIICVPTGVSYGHVRFKSRHEAPKIKAWRCDLTALSRLYNLYFVACNETIHVYRPSFPDQNVPSEPDLILDLPVSSTDLSYGIDFDDSHSVTRLYLDYLGHEEVLVATCDDGDVIGYRIEEIQRHLKDQERLSKSNSDDDAVIAVRTFLHRNVGASAWGLSIHREARMIAISANTHQVTVLAYALASTDSQATDLSESTLLFEDEDEDEDSQDFPSPRARDHVIILFAETNVPAVSFNNNGDDPTGRWLFSSSIDGKTLLWDLHNTEVPARTYEMGWCASATRSDHAPETHFANCLCLKSGNVPHGAWGALFLDPQSAHEVDENPNPKPPPQKLPYFEELVDVSKVFTEGGDHDVDSDNSESDTPLIQNSNMEISDEPDDDSSEEQWSSGDDDDNEEEEEEEEQEPTTQADQIMNDADADDNTNINPHHVGAEVQTLPVDGNDWTTQTDLIAAMASAFDAALLEQGGAGAHPFAQEIQAVESDSDDGDSNEEYDVDFGIPLSMLTAHVPHYIQKPRPYCSIAGTDKAYGYEPRGPCLIITKEEIYLLQSPISTQSPFILKTPVGPTFEGTIITKRRPLHIGRWASYLPSHDRLCFSTQINELGIFIVASPTGRAGIFSLIKYRQPSGTKKGRYTYRYGFNLEYILPFHKNNDREVCQSAVAPGARLIGVAVGPVQGAFDQPAGYEEPVNEFSMRERRWRLLMYFTDHTVLSYEISRSRAGKEPELGELVV